MMSEQTPWTTVLQPEGFRSVAPLPTRHELADFYASEYYQRSVSESYRQAYSDQQIAYKRLYARALLQAIGAPAQAGSLLDVGCGEGYLLAEAEVGGWDVAGIELSSYAIERFNPHVRDRVAVGDADGILSRFESEGRTFGACVLQNVLEHVLDPRQMLTGVRRILSPDAILLVTLPNDYSAIQRLLLRNGDVPREYWFAPPQHLHYFDIVAGTSFARSCGFSVIDVFADFPIEVFLLHPGSNYVRDRALGPAADGARMTMSLLCAQAGIDRYLDLCRAYAGCGIGRAFTLVLTADR